MASAATPGCSRIVLTAHNAYPPVAWAHNGTLEGAGIEVVRRLAVANRVQLSVRNDGSWNAAQTAVKSGKADAIVGLYLTGPRRQFFNYVEPAIAPDPSAVVVRRNETFVYRDWNSLIPSFSTGVKRMTADGTTKRLFADAMRTYERERQQKASPS